jgi:hypothetical protein
MILQKLAEEYLGRRNNEIVDPSDIYNHIALKWSLVIIKMQKSYRNTIFTLITYGACHSSNFLVSYYVSREWCPGRTRVQASFATTFS